MTPLVKLVKEIHFFTQGQQCKLILYICLAFFVSIASLFIFLFFYFLLGFFICIINYNIEVRELGLETGLELSALCGLCCMPSVFIGKVFCSDCFCHFGRYCRSCNITFYSDIINYLAVDCPQCPCLTSNRTDFSCIVYIIQHFNQAFTILWRTMSVFGNKNNRKK